MEFDYIVVGGGSGGCTVASRLSEDPNVSVCLIEAGGEGKNVILRVPSGVAAILPTPILNWAYKSEPQAGLNGRRSYQPRGRALGGSSAINAMLYIRGHRADYDEWRDMGCDGWGYDDVLPFFKKAEDNSRGADDVHGAGGPLSVCDQRSLHDLSHAFIEAGREAQVPATEDFNGPQQEGLGLYQVTQKDGERCSAAAAYIHPNIERPNLTIMSRTQARRILFENRRATGVEIQGKGGPETVTARREVILAAGAFATPQLLMLSGIGPGQHLRDNGIEIIAERNDVGENLQDHIDYVSIYKSLKKDVFGVSPSGTVDIIKAIFEWRRSRTGKLTTPFAEAGGFVKTTPELDRPDIQYHFVVGIVDDHNRKLHLGHGYSCHVCVLRPKSRGNVRLSGNSHRDRPRIDMGYFSDAEDADMKTMLQGFHAMRQILEAPALSPWRGKELYTAGVTDDTELKKIIRDRADTVYHPVGTCRMGPDAEAVVDPQLRVNGVENLRIADASIMPRIIGGNTNAPTIMIAERCADFIQNG